MEKGDDSVNFELIGLIDLTKIKVKSLNIVSKGSMCED